MQELLQQKERKYLKDSEKQSNKRTLNVCSNLKALPRFFEASLAIFFEALGLFCEKI